MTRQTSIQLTEATERQANALRARGFGTFTDVVRISIDRMYNQETGGREMETEDRVQQVGWLRQLAENIAANLSGSTEDTGEELVAYALSDEGRESWGIDLPYWFNDYDRGLLTEWVEEALAR